MNTKLRKKKSQKEFWKRIFQVDNTFFGNSMENVRKHRNIKLVTAERRKNYVVSEPNYHTTKFFTESLLAIEMKKN